VGDEKKGYTFGAVVLGQYSLDENEKWAVQLEGSLHIKKEDDYTYNQSYLLGGLKYDFKDKEKCKSDQEYGAYVRFLLGYSFFSEAFDYMGFSDKFKDCGPAGGIGGGFDIKISDAIRVNIGADYIGTKSNDDYINSFRANAGLNYSFRYHNF